jgi:signal transduction histidine kinase
VKVAHRLYFTVLPSIVAVALLAALTYWGQYEHTAPLTVLVGGAIVVLISSVITWTNARYVTRRIERLARSTPPPALGRGRESAAGADAELYPPSDELEAIENVMGRLSTAIEVSESSRADGALSAQRRVHDYATLLVGVADAMATRLEDVRLPLHILLENRFGELNDNQEEMLGAARVAAEEVDADILQLRQLAALDLGDEVMRRDRLKPSELVTAIRPMLVAAAEAVGATLELRIEPLLPAVIGDRARLQDALVTLCRASIALAPAGAALHADVARRETEIGLTLSGGGRMPISVHTAAAIRVVQAHGGRVDRDGDALGIWLPIESAPPA